MSGARAAGVALQASVLGVLLSLVVWKVLAAGAGAPFRYQGF